MSRGRPEVEARHLRALHEFAVAAGGVLEPSALAQLVVDRARDLLGVESAMLAWWYPDQGELRILADNHARRPLRRTYPGQGAVGVAFERGAPVLVDDFPAWEFATSAASARGDRSVISVPLLVQQRAAGCLRVESSTPGRFSEADVELLTLMAAQVGPAIEAARLAEQTRQQGEVFRALHELASAAGGVLDWRTLAKFVVDKAVELLSAYGSGIALYDAAEDVLRVVAQSGSESMALRDVKPGQGTIGTAFLTRQPVVVDDYSKWSPAINWVQDLGQLSVASVPMMVQDRAIGTLTVSSIHQRHFEVEEVQLLTMLASTVAPALESARLRDDLGKANRQFQTIFQTSPTAMIRCDIRGRVIEANPAAAVIFGYPSPEAMVGLPRDTFVSTETQREAIRQRMRELRAGNTSSYRVLRQGLRQDGSWFWADATVCLVRDADGNEDFYYVMVDDVSERIHAEESLRHSQHLLHSIIENAPVILFTADREGNVTLNEGNVLKRDSIHRAREGRNIFEVYKRHPQVLEHMRRALAGETLSEVMHIDGREKYYEVTSSPIVDDDGALQGWISVSTDVSERVRAEEQLRQSLSTLRRRNGERRRLLARLVSVQEEERRHIAAGIHDDTLQVLANVGFQLERLRRRVGDAGQLEVLDHLDKSLSMAVERLRQLVFELRPHSLDKDGVVPALREYMDEMRADGGIAGRLTSRIVNEPSGPLRVAIYRIAREALSNVRKHAAASRAYVLLDERDEGYFVEVRDNGVGMPPSHEDARPGHLGLLTMRERALQLGGWWRIESPPGGGTRLRFWLPKDPAVPETVEAAQ